MTDKKTIKVISSDGSLADCTLIVSIEPPWILSFHGEDSAGTKFAGRDLFEAFTSLRLTLEKLNMKPLCAGSRLDVFPSGMSRGLGGGSKAYITRIGCQTQKSDLIDIFDYAGPSTVATVAQQKAFHEKWASSLG